MRLEYIYKPRGKKADKMYRRAGFRRSKAPRREERAGSAQACRGLAEAAPGPECRGGFQRSRAWEGPGERRELVTDGSQSATGRDAEVQSSSE